MKRLAGFLAGLAFVAQLQLYASAQQPPDPQKLPPATSGSAVEAPTFNVGDWWEYVRPNRPERQSKFKLTVTEKTGELVTMINRRGDVFVFTKDGNAVELPEGGPRARYEPYAHIEFCVKENQEGHLKRHSRERSVDGNGSQFQGGHLTL